MSINLTQLLTYPSKMEYETKFNKKEGYIQIVSDLEAAEDEVRTLDERCTYLQVLIDTMDAMSFEIFELYKKLERLFKDQLPAVLAENQLSSSQKEQLTYAIKKACSMHVLLEEKYQEWISDVTESQDYHELFAKSQTEENVEDQIECKVLTKSARFATIEIADGGRYFTKDTYHIFVNGIYVKDANTVITSIYDLKPQTEYVIHVITKDGKTLSTLNVTTEDEFVTLNVRDFGAKGDGIQDDTKYIQAAILSCPKNSRVLIPAGTYKITSLFLKSDLRLELQKGAELSAVTDRYEYPMFPGLIESYDEKDEYNLGTWEGNPLPMFSGIITGISVENVLIYGEGVVNGNSSKETWWKDPKIMEGAFRPRCFFINHCENVSVVGVKFCNSPSWTIHPYFSNELKFYNVIIENPSDSPNTDGFDPESCKDIEVAGVRFSLGDDCVAIKAGKIYMGKKHKTCTENMHVRQCLMENGHGAVTIGSEMAGGAKNVVVEDCIFRYTDRGLRIKTRRGRGEDAVLDKIVFRNIDMDHVMTPFVVNCFYFCDPDGKTSYVQSREWMPVDDRTPYIKRLEFENIDAKNCHVAAAYLEGLPEQPIDEIIMRNIDVTYAENPKCDVPAMSEGVEKSSKRGVFANNVGKLVLDNVTITGQVGEALELKNVEKIAHE